LDVSTTSTECPSMTTVTGRTDSERNAPQGRPKDQYKKIRKDGVRRKRKSRVAESLKTESRERLKTSEKEENYQSEPTVPITAIAEQKDRRYR
jgi:hypothetical protein